MAPEDQTFCDVAPSDATAIWRLAIPGKRQERDERRAGFALSRRMERARARPGAAGHWEMAVTKACLWPWRCGIRCAARRRFNAQEPAGTAARGNSERRPQGVRESTKANVEASMRRPESSRRWWAICWRGAGPAHEKGSSQLPPNEHGALVLCTCVCDATQTNVLTIPIPSTSTPTPTPTPTPTSQTPQKPKPTHRATLKPAGPAPAPPQFLIDTAANRRKPPTRARRPLAARPAQARTKPAQLMPHYSVQPTLLHRTAEKERKEEKIRGDDMASRP
ncbi:hypothetical protein P171DRAFT_443174 [Karstenula rhodostoma CBS 690.94]|uniref:Uncharacterized protein n=1 Tax=Karstenula rhodostoma CBS 690.94 TaxID=1392251 RepID=A0A9P4UCU5_9PLEO|nr:hypothetical protein P171DRAFT_443174 [Karstenula rhodostoma CBS 690.94]